MTSSSSEAARRLTAIQTWGACLGLAALFAGLLYVGLTAPAAVILRQDGATPWMAEDRDFQSGSVGSRRGEDPVVVFQRTIQPGAPLGAIEVRALRSFSLEWNGAELASRSGSNWKVWSRIELPPSTTGGDATGAATLRIRVRNPRGPALLQVRGSGEADSFASGIEGWTASRAAGPAAPVVVADDTRRDPRSYAPPRAAAAWADKALAVASFFVFFAFASFWLQRDEAAELRRRAIRLAPWILVTVWGGLFATAIQLPPNLGFDGPDHLAYVHFLIEQRALPFATDGPVMYHPPLFYAASAGLVSVLGRDAEAVALHLLPFASGVALALLAGAIVWAIYPGDRLRASLATAFIGLLPMNLYMASYLSNEGLHAAMAACAIWLLARQLLAPRTDRAQLAVVGLVLGGAILCKVTSLLYVPIFCCFVAGKQRVLDRAGWGAVLGSVVALLATCGIVCGWFFLRNHLHLGQALVGNWNVPGSDVTWWQPPGFRTLGYYTAFGDALVRPFFASSHSFLDGMYSTFWTDALIGGIAEWRDRHDGWNYEYMVIASGLALPAALLGMAGTFRTVAESLTGEDLRRRVALCFVLATGLSTALVLLLLGWIHPARGMTKAFYGLAVTGPIALVGVQGFLWADGWLAARGLWARITYHAWAATLAVVIALAFLA